MPDKIEELVERLRTIEQQLEAIMRHLPEPEPAADQTVAEGAIDLTAAPRTGSHGVGPREHAELEDGAPGERLELST